MKYFLMMVLVATGFTAAAQPTQNDIWINEFHYDGATLYGQADVGEFVEIVAKSSIVSNPAELAKYKLVLFTSGAVDAATLSVPKGTPYNFSSTWYSLAETEHPLSSFTACSQTVSGYSIFSKTLPILQDVPAALALVYDNTTVVQLLSYEKSFKIVNDAAVAGPAANQTTALITTALLQPAQETALTSTTHSISLTGTGSGYSNFIWDDGTTIMATPCSQNQNQTITSTILPVRWLNFTATGTKDKINLQWLVASEDNTVGYDVQLRNNDGSFSTKATILKDVSKAGSYTGELTQLLPGIYFVRIKSVEKDGSYLYSAIRNVNVGSNKNSVLVYPNPVKQQTTLLQFTPNEKVAYTATLFDGTGRMVKQQQLGLLQAGQSNTVTLQLQNLEPGIYRLKITGLSDIFTTTIQMAY